MGCSRPDARLAEQVVIIGDGGCLTWPKWWRDRLGSWHETVAHMADLVSMQKRPMPAGATLRRAFFGALAFHPPPYQKCSEKLF